MLNQIMSKMIWYSRGNQHDIDHFLKVHAYSRLIGQMEALDLRTQEILEIAATLHDIACPLCRVKYGNTDGSHQEDESEALLRPFLEEFSLPAETLERVIYLVSHHHTYTHIDGIDYQVLVEADFLVNASESKMARESIAAFGQRVFKTNTGKALLSKMYLQ